MSWAAFKDFSLDFTKSWASEQISVGGAASSLYVTAVEDGVPTLSATASSDYVAHILGYYKNSTYGLYYNAKVKVPVEAGKYRIDLGMSDYGGNVAISDGTTVLTSINSKGDKFAVNSANVASGEVTVGSECVLEIYASENATNVYFPYIKVVQLESASAPAGTERVATWDFTTMAANAVNIQGKTGKVDSNVSALSLDVDATNNGKLTTRGSDAQFNNGTVIKVPVRSAGDIVTVVSYPGYHNYKVAGVDADEDTEVYTATDADASAGSVSIAATGSAYLYSISVKQISVEENNDESEFEERIAMWDWKTAAPGSALANETNILARIGSIHSNLNGVLLEVDASGNGRFDIMKSGNVNVAQMSQGVIIKVPVQHAGDIVTVVSPSNGFAYTVAGVPATKKETTYTVNETEAQKGFITIVATANSAKLYSITVKQLAFKSVIPKIKLNSAGWASFTSVLPGAVLMCPIGSTAYVATEVGGGVVTLAPVTKFTYGQGVFIKGDANSEILPVVTEGVSDVPTEGNITEGCTENVELYTESGAYIVATNTVTGEAGFFRVIGNNVVVPAGKAYLYGPLEEDAKAALSEDAKMLKIVFANGEQATGIESVIAAKAVAPTEFYNLSGQKVGKDYKGVVVGNNGVKYVK